VISWESLKLGYGWGKFVSDSSRVWSWMLGYLANQLEMAFDTQPKLRTIDVS
jgi:hypothetical protein